MQIFAVALFVIWANISWPYHLTQDFRSGFYWSNFPLKFKILETNPERKKLLEELSRKAMGEWESSTSSSIWDLAEAGTMNIIRWSDRFSEETQMDAQSVLAVAIRYTEGPYFAKSEIIINGNHPDFNSSMAWWNKMNLQTTITHELGHTMGLDHSQEMEAIMAPTLQTPYMGLHHDDLEGMREVITQSEERQLTRYISPLAYEKTKQVDTLSCASTYQSGSNIPFTGVISFIVGYVTSLLRRLWQKFKSF